MILLLGGTSETARIADELAETGLRVLVSLATDTPLDLPARSEIQTRRGRLDVAAMAKLVREHGISAIVDAGHPYAAELHATARRAAEATDVPLFPFVRPAAIPPDAPGVVFVKNHQHAANAAFADGRPVLLTTGANHLNEYVEASRRTGVRLIVRVLDREASHAACRKAGLPADCIMAGRGPFGVQDNQAQIRRLGIGVLVTKDSGNAGGTLEKLAAAQAEGCLCVAITRPLLEGVSDISQLVEAVKKAVSAQKLP